MHRRAATAFTLLEMIVVLAIASLIIGIGAGAVQRVTEEHALMQVAHAAERECMQAMTRTLATARPQDLDLTTLAQGAKLTLRRIGSTKYITATGQHLFLRPGGLCEPLTLRWQRGDAWVSATLDPLTGAFSDLEENL
jgi:prepilin-type N-terminal cleavage/methylation domain-containing protein